MSMVRDHRDRLRRIGSIKRAGTSAPATWSNHPPLRHERQAPPKGL